MAKEKHIHTVSLCRGCSVFLTLRDMQQAWDANGIGPA